MTSNDPSDTLWKMSPSSAVLPTTVPSSLRNTKANCSMTTPSGITYERASLREHLQKVGAFDPVTRAPLRLEQAVPNIALRETIREYLDEHPWAYESNL